MTDPASVHRALADPRRAELVAALEDTVEALDATELGRRVGLHANTVRWHLGILEDAGIVASHPEHRDTPGRPRRVWERTRGTVHDEADEHRALARALVSVVGGLPHAVWTPRRPAARGAGSRLDAPVRPPRARILSKASSACSASTASSLGSRGSR